MPRHTRTTQEEKGQATLSQRMLVEAVGTFLLVFVGAGSVIATGGSNLVAIALANGIALAIAVSFAMGISGGHINPAVTIAAYVTGKIKGLDAFGYILAQLLGAILAGIFLIGAYPVAAGAAVHYGTPGLGSGVSVLGGIIFEGIMTFILVFVVFGTVIDSRAPKIGGFAVGLAVVVDALAGGPFTGAAMNPARAIGPAIASLYFANWYVYWIGPIIGAIIAGLLYKNMILKE